MRRVSRLLVLLVVTTMLVLAVRPAGRVHSATLEPALWVDGANPACRDTQARVLDPARPYCTVARAAALVLTGDTVRIAPGRYAGVVRPAQGGTPLTPVRFVADAPGVVLDGAGAANTVRLIGTGDVRFEGLDITGGANQGVWVEAADRVVLDHVRVRANAGAGVQVKSGSGTIVTASTLEGNARAGLLELAGGRSTTVIDSVVTGNGRDGLAYNGDGLQLGGSGEEVARSDISGNGDSQYEHGIYTAAGASGYRLHDNRLAGNSGANIKAAGTGQIAGNRIVDGRWGLVLSDNPDRVAVVQNVIGGTAQHLVFLTSGTTPARALLWQNTIAQRGRSTTTGDASAIFAVAAADLELRNNLVAYTGSDAAGVSIALNDLTRVGRLVSDTNWWTANDAQSRHLALDGSRVTLATWRARTGQDLRSLTSWAPVLDADLRVTSTNWGARRGDSLGLATDFAGQSRAATGPVDIGAYNAIPLTG
jgi:parallel beta helix pectate lyase-like protein